MQDRSFTVDLIFYVLSHEGDCLTDSEEKPNPLASSLLDFLGTLMYYLTDEDSSVGLAKRVVQTTTKYLVELERCQPQLLAADNDNMTTMNKSVSDTLAVNLMNKKLVEYVRVVELFVSIACQSELLCQSLAKPALSQIFEDFFSDDIDLLTKVVIMDFIVILADNEFGVKVMNESSFISKLFDFYGGANSEADSFGFVGSNMLLVGAKLYSMDPALFNAPENKNFMITLRSYVSTALDSDKPHLKDVGMSALYFLLKQRDHCLIPHLIGNPQNHDLINSLLRVAKTTNVEHRKSFLMVMRQLLKVKGEKVGDTVKYPEIDERTSDVLRMIFSNITSPEKFPQAFGQLDSSISLLVNLADTPYD